MLPTTLGRFTVTGTTEQVGAITDALAACTFPVADRLPRTIPVTFTNLSSYSALGLFWTDGRIEIEQSLTRDEQAPVFLSEAWHAIDQYILTSGDRAALTAAAHGVPDGHTWFDNGSYYASLGETMMDTFLLAYSPYPLSGLRWEHPVTPQLADVLRGILTPDAPTEPDSSPLADFPYAELDDWARRTRAWWPTYGKTAARAYEAWKARHQL